MQVGNQAVLVDESETDSEDDTVFMAEEIPDQRVSFGTPDLSNQSVIECGLWQRRILILLVLVAVVATTPLSFFLPSDPEPPATFPPTKYILPPFLESLDPSVLADIKNLVAHNIWRINGCGITLTYTPTLPSDKNRDMFQ